MARKSFVQLQQDLLTAFPDNITGLITPAILRGFLDSFLQAIRPAYGLVSRPNATAQVVTSTDAPLVFDSGYVSDVPDFVATPATGTLQRVDAGTTRMTLNATMEGANGRLVSMTLYKNGVPTAWKASVTLAGAGKPVDVSMYSLTYDGAPAAYQMRVKCDTASESISFSNMDFFAESIPVNAY